MDYKKSTCTACGKDIWYDEHWKVWSSSVVFFHIYCNSENDRHNPKDVK